MPPNGVRYPRVGGTRGRRFAGTHSKPRKLPENAQTPTRLLHAVLGRYDIFGLYTAFREPSSMIIANQRHTYAIPFRRCSDNGRAIIPIRVARKVSPQVSILQGPIMKLLYPIRWAKGASNKPVAAETRPTTTVKSAIPRGSFRAMKTTHFHVTGSER